MSPLPNSPSAGCVKADALDDAFDPMLLNQTTASNDNFSGNLCGTDTEDALLPFGIDERRLKDCKVSTLASVWGIPKMRLVQLKACFCLLHPHHPNSLVVVHQTGGRKTNILCTLGVIKRGIILIFIPLLTLSANVMHKFESSNPTWGNVGVYHLDKIFDYNRSAYKKLLHCCSEIKQSKSSTLFSFLLPQFLINCPRALGVFITCAQEWTLQLKAFVKKLSSHCLSFEESSIQDELFLEAFDNILFMPGNQHAGMNMLQSLHKIFLTDLLKPLRDILGWNRKAKDVQSCYYQALRLVKYTNNVVSSYLLRAFLSCHYESYKDRMRDDNTGDLLCSIAVEFQLFLSRLLQLADDHLQLMAYFFLVSGDFFEFVLA